MIGFYGGGIAINKAHSIDTISFVKNILDFCHIFKLHDYRVFDKIQL